MQCRIFEDFLTEDQCIDLIEMSRNRLEKSLAWDVKEGKSVPDDYRNSEQTFYQVSENDLVKQIEQKIADVTGAPIENGEGLQVVHYRPGGFYKPHWDFFDPQYPSNINALSRGGQRVITVIMYLNDSSVGTYFPIHEITFKNKTGRAVLWYNVMPPNMEIDRTTYHEGQVCPPNEERWIVTKWIHESKFT